MADLIEAVGAPPYRDRAGLTELERSLSFEVDDLFSATDALNILRFADLKDGKLTLTSDGAQFAQLGTYERKALFAQHLLRYVPLAAHISDVLTKRGEHQAPRRRFQR